MLACESGNVPLVRAVLEASEQALGEQVTKYLNEPDSKGNTALILACTRDHPTVVQLLLDKGANPLIANRRGETALHAAAYQGSVACIEFVLNSPVDESMTSDGSRGIAATTVVSAYGGLSRYIDAHSSVGFAPLHLAVIAASPESAAALVQHGAALDVPVLRGLERYPFLCGGSTALHVAAGRGDARMCIVLLSGPLSGHRDNTPFDFRHTRNMLGLTPLDCALSNGYHEVARLMIEHGRRLGRRGGFQDGQELCRYLRALEAVVSSGASSKALRTHMQAVIQQAALLLQLKEIYKTWQADGILRTMGKKGSDVTAVLSGLESISQIRQLQKLLQVPAASLHDVFPSEGSTVQGRGEQPTQNIERVTPPTTATADRTVLGPHMLPPGAPSIETQTLGGTGNRRRQQQTDVDMPESLEPEDIDPEIARVSERGSNETGEPQREGREMDPSGAPAARLAGSEMNASLVGSRGEGSLKRKGPTETVDCQICMDADVEVSFGNCRHATCFECACRLCLHATESLACPFCRQDLTSVQSLVMLRCAT